MTDMSLTIAPKSDQLNADDLIAGPKTITITSVSANPGNAEQPVSVSFQGDNGKPYRPCKSMRRVMVHCWGKDGQEYTGRAMTLYRDPEVTWGGMKVGGIRISHMSHIEKAQTMALTATQKQRKPFTVKPLEVERGPDKAEVQTKARAVAKEGTDAFRKWWADNPNCRPAAKEIMAELQKSAKEADDVSVPVAEDDDPFGLSPVDEGDNDPTPSPEEREAAEREAREASEAQDRDHSA